MAKKTYPVPIKETREVVVGWIHRCEVCGEEFRTKRKTGVRYCPNPKPCRMQAHRSGK